MTHVTHDFVVSYPSDGDLDYIRVACVGVGSRGDQYFKRHDFNVGYYEHNPYSLVAKQWFIDHPPRPDWKVGDVVPKNTSVGKDWTAAPFRTKAEAGPYADYGTIPMNVGARMMCREDRVILWIAP